MNVIDFFIMITVIGIFTSLGLGLYFLWHDSGSEQRMVKALRIRVTLSLLLFFALLLGFLSGNLSWQSPF